MRVKMKTIMCGPAGNFSIGEVADFDAMRAAALISGGYAEAIDQPVTAMPKTTDVKIPETAVARNQRKK